MARRRFTVGTRYTYKKQVFIVREMLVNDSFLIENLSFGGRIVMSQTELSEVWARGEITFEVHGPQTQKLRDSLMATAYKIADFKRLPPRGRDEAWRRYEILLPILKLPIVKRTRTYMDDYAASLPTVSNSENLLSDSQKNPRKGKKIGQATSRSSIEQWLYSFIESGYDIRSLVPATDRLGGKGKHRLDEDVEKIVESVLAECQAKPKHRTNKDVYLLVVNRIAEENRFRKTDDQLTVPGKTTLYRRIQQRGNSSILRRRASRMEMQAESQVSPGPKPTRILERVEMDDTTLDLIVVDLDDRLPIGRPTITFALDCFSDWPCGVYVGFEPPSYESVQACLLYSILPKPDCQQIYGTKHPWPVYGLPEVLVVDNGKQYICSDLEDACGQLGIILEQMPVKKAWFKARVERFFGTNNTGLIHGLPGTTFSNIFDRGDYDSSQHACISLSGFLELLHVFLLDVYAQDWHEGIGGGSGGIPAKLWEESIKNGYLPSLHHDADEMRILLYNSERRTVQRSGIDFEALRYQDSVLLAPLRDRLRKRKKARGPANPEDQNEVEDDRAHVRVNPADLSEIYVYDDDPENSKWLTIPAIDQEYTKGLSLWKHRVIRNYLLRQKKEVNMYELAAAKQHIQEIVDREYELTRKGRKKLARYRGVNARPHLTLVPNPSVSPPLETEPNPTDLPGEARESKGINETDVPTSTGTPASNGQKNKRGKPKSSASTQTGTNAVPEHATESKLSSREGWGGDYDLP